MTDHIKAIEEAAEAYANACAQRYKVKGMVALQNCVDVRSKLQAAIRAGVPESGKAVGSVYTMEALVPGGVEKCYVTLHRPLPAGTNLYTHAQPTTQAGEDGTFLILPPRPKAEAPANTIGVDWDAYSGMQMLAYGRMCADAAIAAQQGDKT